MQEQGCSRQSGTGQWKLPNPSAKLRYRSMPKDLACPLRRQKRRLRQPERWERPKEIALRRPELRCRKGWRLRRELPPHPTVLRAEYGSSKPIRRRDLPSERHLRAPAPGWDRWHPAREGILPVWWDLLRGYWNGGTKKTLGADAACHLPQEPAQPA